MGESVGETSERDSDNIYDDELWVMMYRIVESLCCTHNITNTLIKTSITPYASYTESKLKNNLKILL